MEVLSKSSREKMKYFYCKECNQLKKPFIILNTDTYLCRECVIKIQGVEIK